MAAPSGTVSVVQVPWDYLADQGWTGPRHLHARQGGGQGLLTWALTREIEPPVIHTLIEAGCSLEADAEGWTPLVAALAFTCNDDLLHTVIRAGADLEAWVPNGNPPGHLAPDPPKHLTALMVAVVWAPDKIGLLLKAGANPNTQVDGGVTALMIATMQHSALSIQRLLDAGADPLVRDEQGRTALDRGMGLAPSYRYREDILEPLREATERAQERRLLSEACDTHRPASPGPGHKRL